MVATVARSNKQQATNINFPRRITSSAPRWISKGISKNHVSPMGHMTTYREFFTHPPGAAALHVMRFTLWAKLSLF